MTTPVSITPGLYRHYKGNLYRVMGVAQHSETLEHMVVYQALYGDRMCWVRPVEMFLETVEINGEPIERFQLERADPPVELPTGAP